MKPTGSVIFQGGTVPVRSYREDGYQEIPKVMLSDEAYADGLQRFVPLCADVVIVEPKSRTIYLMERRAKPMQGLWWFGGSMNAKETPVEAAVRAFKRETGITLAVNGLVLRMVATYLWKDRAQQPDTIGCHMADYIFTTELSPEAISMIDLDKKEFVHEKGFRPYTHEELVAEKVFPPILDLYDAVFPPVQQPTVGRLECVHYDDRRELREWNLATSSIQVITIKNGTKPLGKHFHKKKTETFTILQGNGEVLLGEVDAKGTSLHPPKHLHVGAGAIIEVPPFHAHTFYLSAGAKLHCFSSEPYDEKDFFSVDWLVCSGKQ